MSQQLKDYIGLLAQADRHRELQAMVTEAGYDAFRVLADQFEAMLKHVGEEGFADLAERIAAAERLFPEPARFSPAWQKIWQELRAKLRWTRHVYETIPAAGRDGEWQIILDNPFTNNEIACYPALSFAEAAYLFGYFKPGLEKNEYIRLQKVITAIEMTGD